MFGIHSTSRKLGLVGVAAALALALGSCTGGGSSSSSSSGPTSATGSPIKGGTVTFAETAATQPNWIFPMASLAYFSVYNISNLQQQMYRPLYWFGGHDDQPTIDYGLSVAEPPEYASDGKSVTIKLKPWKWSNGEDVNAFGADWYAVSAAGAKVEKADIASSSGGDPAPGGYDPAPGYGY